jgi:tetraacyldisaccharide 4'-kinase
MNDALQRFFDRVWYGERSLSAMLLSPLAALVGALTARKRRRYLDGVAHVVRPTIPVIVVGNLTVGGTGKTPLVIWLVQQLQQHGYRPGIVTRGYGGKAPHYPYLIQPRDSATVTGDEPLLLFRRTGVPVVVDPRRGQAALALQDQTDCDVIISDDGLQHYGLGRTYEIVVLDGTRGLGNGRLLPAGPLRESLDRLRNVNALVINGSPRHSSFGHVPRHDSFALSVEPGAFVSLDLQKTATTDELRNRTDWVAVAGIGNPERFFVTLEQLGLQFRKAPFPDHHVYVPDDFAPFAGAPILTTEKDAVKLQGLGLRGWYLPIDARVQPGLIDDILAAIERFKTHSQHLY